MTSQNNHVRRRLPSKVLTSLPPLGASLALAVVLLVADSHGQGETIHRTIVHDDLMRKYQIYIPTNYTSDQEWPLVVNIHGLNITADHQVRFSKMNDVAEREGFLVAYPDAINRDWVGGEDNVDFIETMVGVIESEYAIDHTRVYATGLSQGAMMSYLLAGEKPELFAAIAAVSGTPYITTNGEPFPLQVPFVPERPIPLLHIHGTGDESIPYGGGIRSAGQYTSDFPPVEDFVGGWLENNGSQMPFVFEPLPDIDTSDNTTVDLFSCSDCGRYIGVSGQERVTEVLLYRINDGGHNWPGDASVIPSNPILHPVNQDIDGSTEIWKFFSRHELPAAPSPDFNADDEVDVSDVDLLVNEIASVSDNLVFDLSKDGMIDADDLREWLRIAAATNGFPASYQSGDSNLDGTVNAVDLNNLALNWQQSVALWSGGDFTADGAVNSADLNLLGLNWQQSIPLAASTNTAVPEPSAFLLTLAGIAFCCGRSRSLVSL